MSEFKNVTVIKKANVYFDGKVTSRTVLFGEIYSIKIVIQNNFTPHLENFMCDFTCLQLY